jgi:hypothetical protein
MRRHLDPEVNYSTILFEGMAKWRPSHLVEAYSFDVFPGFTRLSIRFREDLIERTPIPVGSRDVIFDYDETRLTVTWTGRDGKGWRFSMSPESIGGPGIDNMIGFLNYPLGALATITQDHMSLATRWQGAMPADMPRAPSIRLEWSDLEAVGKHRDVSAFMFTKTEKGMNLCVKLKDTSPLPVGRGDDGSRILSFDFTPEDLSLSWGTDNGGVDERSWPLEAIGRTEFACDILPDLMGHTYRTLTGEKEADIRGKAANPVWRLFRSIEDSGLKPGGMPGAHG